MVQLWISILGSSFFILTCEEAEDVISTFSWLSLGMFLNERIMNDSNTFFQVFFVQVAGMRILPVSKLIQILRSSRPPVRGRTVGSDVAGNLKTLLTGQCNKGSPNWYERAYSVASESGVGVSQTGAWRAFIVPGWRFMGTVAGAPRFTGAGPVGVFRQDGNVSLFQVWKAWRLKEFDSLFQGMKELAHRKHYPGNYWRPAVFVSLADKKGQVY